MHSSDSDVLCVHHLLSYSGMTRDLICATLESQYRVLVQQLGQEQDTVLMTHNRFYI